MLEAGIAEDPGNVDLRRRLVDVLVLAGDDERAVQTLKELAKHFAAQGQAAKSLAMLKKIEIIDPAAVPVAPVAVAPVPVARPAGRPPKRGEEHTTSVVVKPGAWFRKAVEERTDFHWSPLLRTLSREELVAVVGGLRLLVKKPGSIVYVEGEPGESLFILARGTVRVYKRDPKGHPIQARVLHDGDFFGKTSVLTGHPRTTTVIAAAECELLELERAVFDKIAETHPKVRQLVEDLERISQD